MISSFTRSFEETHLTFRFEVWQTDGAARRSLGHPVSYLSQHLSARKTAIYNFE